MQDLNDTNSVPSDVIASLYQNVSRESELGAGDIHNIIDVLNVALDVQYDRLESAEDPTDYADKYTTESVTMIIFYDTGEEMFNLNVMFRHSLGRCRCRQHFDDLPFFLWHIGRGRFVSYCLLNAV